MTEKFVASNGVIVDQVPTTIGNRFVVQDVNPAQREGSRILSRSNWLDPRDADALREFFQQERDLELGRWRWPKNPEWVMYQGGPGSVWVFDEDDPYLTRIYCSEVSRVPFSNNSALGAATAYFAAHPEPKPWHDAKPGEVWVLTVDGSEYAWGVGTGVDVGRFRFVGGESNIPVTSADITAGRKIWPEAPDV